MALTSHPNNYLQLSFSCVFLKKVSTSVLPEWNSLIVIIKMAQGYNSVSKLISYRNAEVMKKRAGDELVRVVVLVRWEQLTQKFIVDIRGGSQVVRKTWRDFQTGEATLAAVFNMIWTDIGDVQVGKLVSLEVNKSHTFGRSSAESFASLINNFGVDSGHVQEKTRVES